MGLADRCLCLAECSGAAPAAGAWKFRPKDRPSRRRTGAAGAGRISFATGSALGGRLGVGRRLLYFVLGWAIPFVIAVGLIVSLLGVQLEGYLAERKHGAKIESQLADAIDLMVGALGPGPASPTP